MPFDTVTQENVSCEIHAKREIGFKLASANGKGKV